MPSERTLRQGSPGRAADGRIRPRELLPLPALASVLLDGPSRKRLLHDRGREFPDAARLRCGATRRIFRATGTLDAHRVQALGRKAELHQRDAYNLDHKIERVLSGLGFGPDAFLWVPWVAGFTIVAASMCPIVLAMLKFIGVEDLKASVLGTAMMVAVAWGTSVGGFATPLGGAPNLLTIQFIQDSITNREFLFVTWLTRFLPMTVGLVIVSIVYMRFAFRPEMAEIEGSRMFFLDRIRALGRMSAQEKWGLSLFLVATALAFGRPFYAALLPALAPAYAFLVCGLLCFVIRKDGEPLITWKYAQANMMWGLFYLFAGGTALGHHRAADRARYRPAAPSARP